MIGERGDWLLITILELSLTYPKEKDSCKIRSRSPQSYPERDKCMYPSAKIVYPEFTDSTVGHSISNRYFACFLLILFQLPPRKFSLVFNTSSTQTTKNKLENQEQSCTPTPSPRCLLSSPSTSPSPSSSRLHLSRPFETLLPSSPPMLSPPPLARCPSWMTKSSLRVQA